MTKLYRTGKVIRNYIGGTLITVTAGGGATFPIVYAIKKNDYYLANNIVEHTPEQKKARCEGDKKHPDAVDGDCSRFYKDGNGFNPKSGDGFKWGHVFK